MLLAGNAAVKDKVAVGAGFPCVAFFALLRAGGLAGNFHKVRLFIQLGQSYGG